MKLFKKLGLIALTTVNLLGMGSFGSVADVLAQETVTIEYWHQAADTQGGQATRDLIAKFNESQDEVEVVEVFNADGYPGIMQNLQAAAAGGNLPAISQIGWSHREYFVNNFYFVNPEDVVAEYFSEDESYINDKFEQNIIDLAVSNDGTFAGMPYAISVPVLYANMDILNEAGINSEDIQTWEDVRDASNTVVENTDYEGLFVEPTGWINQTMLEMNGTKLLTDGSASFATEKGFEAYQLVQDMIQEGSAINVTASEGYSSYLSGDVAFATLSIAKRADVTNNAAFEAIGIQFPAFEGEEHNAPAGGNFLTITSDDPEQQQAAWKFLKFLFEPENIAVWIEGTGYFPHTKDAVDDEELNKLINEDPIYQGATANYENIVEWVAFPGDTGVQAEQIIVDMVEGIAGGANVEEIMTNAQDEINNLLN